jgi:hypothetical protein
MKVEGSCHCGQLSFEAEVNPEDVRICHCTDCQVLSGSVYRVNVKAPLAGFVLKSGTPQFYVKTAESGNRRAHAFCANCGTQIYSADEHQPRAYSIRVGTLKQRAELRPTRQIWYRSALPWVSDIRDVAQSECQ